MGHTACTEPQCLYSTAIPLLPLWAVRPVQNLSACIRVHFILSLFTARIEEHTDLCSSLDSEHGNVAVCCTQKLLALNEVDLKFTTYVIFSVDCLIW